MAVEALTSIPNFAGGPNDRRKRGFQKMGRRRIRSSSPLMPLLSFDSGISHCLTSNVLLLRQWLNGRASDNRDEPRPGEPIS